MGPVTCYGGGAANPRWTIFRGSFLSYTSTIPRPASHAPRQIGRSDGDRVFRAAARHSRFVRFLRIAIPASIVLITAVIVVTTFFNPFRLIAAFPIDPGKISLSGTKIVMELPRLNGFTSDSRPYELTARAAAQDITKPDILELKDIDARVATKDGQQVTITSINGIYDTKNELLKLSDNIVLNSTSYEGHLSEATVNVSTGYIVSESPVAVKLTNGWLNANRLEVLENGDLMRFGGGVEMTLNPDQPASAPQGPAPSGATAQVPVRRGSVVP
jgi:lipopolysaccharide export system protein LptC